MGCSCPRYNSDHTAAKRLGRVSGLGVVSLQEPLRSGAEAALSGLPGRLHIPASSPFCARTPSLPGGGGCILRLSTGNWLRGTSHTAVASTTPLSASQVGRGEILVRLLARQLGGKLLAPSRVAETVWAIWQRAKSSHLNGRLRPSGGYNSATQRCQNWVPQMNPVLKRKQQSKHPRRNKKKK